MKTLLLTVLLGTLFSLNVKSQVPTITSFSPTSGPIGTTVTIIGSNFSTTPANNIVYFGAVKAVVMNALADKLIVKVPSGTTYQPISLTINGLTAYSTEPFNLTFKGGQYFTPYSFANEVNFGTGPGPENVVESDIDGDGKPDLVIINYNSDSVSVLRNTTFDKNISFALKLDFQTGASPLHVSVVDFDGDGKPDLAVANYDDYTVSILRNTGDSGNISFDGKKDYVTGSSPLNTFSADFDGDGKPDLAVVNKDNNSITLYRNISSVGNISFDTAMSFATGRNPLWGCAADLDGDGKPDIAVVNSFDRTVSILRNTASPGHVSFDIKKDFITGYYPINISAGDLDADGKKDLVISVEDSISILKNTCLVGSMSFANQTEYPINQSFCQANCIGDLNGDGKPDVALASNNSCGSPANISLFKNSSSNGNISFEQAVDYSTGYSCKDYKNVTIGDLDGDGKPDLISPSYDINKVSILRNQLGDSASAELCPNGSAMLFSNLTGADYHWQLNTGAGFINITDNSNYSGSLTGILQLNNVPSSWYGYMYRCVVNGNNSSTTSLRITDYWNSNVWTTWESKYNWSCISVPDSNTDVIINSGKVILNSNTTIRSLKVSPGASFTVNAPYKLTVTH